MGWGRKKVIKKESKKKKRKDWKHGEGRRKKWRINKQKNNNSKRNEAQRKKVLEGKCRRVKSWKKQEMSDSCHCACMRYIESQTKTKAKKRIGEREDIRIMTAAVLKWGNTNKKKRACVLAAVLCLCAWPSRVCFLLAKNKRWSLTANINSASPAHGQILTQNTEPAHSICFEGTW